MGQHTAACLMAAPWEIQLITVKVVALEKPLLVIHKILRLFVNTLAVNDKYYLHNRDNLTQPTRTQLCQKKNFFSKIFFAFLKSILNFKPSPKKYDPHSWCISGNTGSKKYG